MKPVDEQLALIRRGVAAIETEAELRKKLQTGKPLRVKYGIDPTGIDVHLGHTVPLRKLKQFQELGHKAVLILGDYTALVGDPSGRDQTRTRLTPEQVEKNAADYLEQVGKIIKIKDTEVHRNGEWFGKFDLLRVLELTSQITIQRMLERDDFTKRLKEDKPIQLRECLYPLMQGHDSVEIKADLELGGTEQLFNLMVGRDLQRDAGQEPQVCITLPILRGTDGEKRMGKSLKNYVGIAEPPNEQFGKTMSIPDAIMQEWFELLTDRPAEEISELISANAMQAKKTLGRDIVGFYYGTTAAAAAQAEFERRFSKGEDPTEIPEVQISPGDLQDGKLTIVKLLLLTKLVTSSNEARRVLGPTSGVTIGPDRQRITEPTTLITVTDGLIVRKGKGRHIARVRLTPG
jgi:tyrosyl-tRNA synthetase